jgi:hypothetical protein
MTLIMMVWMLNTIDPKNMRFIEGWQQQSIWL